MADDYSEDYLMISFGVRRDILGQMRKIEKRK
jgi:hypothetical protein